jgi:hypothetical protein
LSVPGVASPGAAGYDFLGKQLRVGWRGERMDWARILAFVTGMVDQELPVACCNAATLGLPEDTITCGASATTDEVTE